MRLEFALLMIFLTCSVHGQSIREGSASEEFLEDYTNIIEDNFVIEGEDSEGSGDDFCFEGSGITDQLTEAKEYLNVFPCLQEAVRRRP